MAFFLKPQPISEIAPLLLNNFHSREPDLNTWLVHRAMLNELLEGLFRHELMVAESSFSILFKAVARSSQHCRNTFDPA